MREIVWTFWNAWTLPQIWILIKTYFKSISVHSNFHIGKFHQIFGERSCRYYLYKNEQNYIPVIIISCGNSIISMCNVFNLNFLIHFDNLCLLNVWNVFCHVCGSLFIVHTSGNYTDLCQIHCHLLIISVNSSNTLAYVYYLNYWYKQIRGQFNHSHVEK